MNDKTNKNKVMGKHILEGEAYWKEDAISNCYGCKIHAVNKNTNGQSNFYQEWKCVKLYVKQMS